LGDAATDSLHVQDRTEEGRSSTASEASGPHRVLVVDTHHYCRSRDYAGSYSRADLGETPQPTLLLGLFGSRLFAKIDLFNLQQTEAPIFTGCGLFPDLRWALADRHGHPRLHRRSPSQSAAVRRLQDSNLSSWWVLLLLAAGRSRPESARFDASLS
jgi:hypothetical protein